MDKAFLTKICGENYQITKLLGDASGKQIFRISISPQNSMILVIIPPSLPQSYEHFSFTIPNKTQKELFIETLEFVENELDLVPKIIATSGDMILLEDLGDTTLHSYKGENKMSYYTTMIQWLVRFQSLGNKKGIDRKLDKDGFMLELQELQTYSDIPFDYDLIEKFVVDPVSSQPVNLIHRDFQSKNVMIHKNKPYIIDLQDICYGPHLYDYASMIFDPNANLPTDIRIQLIKDIWIYYSNDYPSFPIFLELFRITGIMRLLHSIARHSMIYKTRGREISKKSIDRGKKMLQQIIDNLESSEVKNIF